MNRYFDVPAGRGGGVLFKLYRHERRQRVWSLNRFGLKKGLDFILYRVYLARFWSEIWYRFFFLSVFCIFFYLSDLFSYGVIDFFTDYPYDL